MAEPKGLTPAKFVNLWKHECTRVFADRLISLTDVAAYEELLEIVTKKYFKDIQPDPTPAAPAAAAAPPPKAASAANGAEDNKEQKETKPVVEPQPLIFASFATNERSYEQVKSMTSLKDILNAK